METHFKKKHKQYSKENIKIQNETNKITTATPKQTYHLYLKQIKKGKPNHETATTIKDKKEIPKNNTTNNAMKTI